MKNFTKKVLATVLALNSLVVFGASVASFASGIRPRGVILPKGDGAGYSLLAAVNSRIIDGIKYVCNFNDDNTVELSKWERYENLTNVRIPAEVDGFCVTKVSGDFTDVTDRIVLPNGIICIGDFYTNCKEVHIPTLQSIDGTYLQIGKETTFVYDDNTSKEVVDYLMNRGYDVRHCRALNNPQPELFDREDEDETFCCNWRPWCPLGFFGSKED